MANEIQSKAGSRTALTITLASLASSTSGVGRQSTIVTGNVAPVVHLYVKIRTGTSPTANRNIYAYLIKSDGTNRTDAAGASDAAWTRTNARLLGVIRITSSSSNIDYYGEFTIRNPGAEWGIGIVQDSGVNLNSTGGNHAIAYRTETPEVQ